MPAPNDDSVMPRWMIPAVYVIVSFLAAVVLPRVEYAVAPGHGNAISVSTAQALLGAVSSGMMAFTGIVFSIALLLIQYTATAFSKRFILLFRRHNVIFHALGLFVATFTFSLGTLAFVGREDKGWVPVDSIVIVDRDDDERAEVGDHQNASPVAIGKMSEERGADEYAEQGRGAHPAGRDRIEMKLWA
jgi:hypothetical protein